MDRLKPSTLDRQITIKQKVAGRDSFGQPSTSWVAIASGIWASRRAPTGMGTIGAERAASGTQVSVVQYSYRIRWRAGITAAMCVEDTQIGVLDIKQVIYDVHGREWVDLVCAVGANQGG